MSATAPWWVTPLVGVLAILGTYLATRFTGRSSVDVAKVNDEDRFRQSLMAWNANQESRIVRLEAGREVGLNHISALEDHIRQGKPPPPPQRPPGL